MRPGMVGVRLRHATRTFTYVYASAAVFHQHAAVPKASYRTRPRVALWFRSNGSTPQNPEGGNGSTKAQEKNPKMSNGSTVVHQ